MRMHVTGFSAATILVFAIASSAYRSLDDRRDSTHHGSGEPVVSPQQRAGDGRSSPVDSQLGRVKLV